MMTNVCLVAEESCVATLGFVIEGLIQNLQDANIYIVVPESQLSLFKRFEGLNIQIVSEDVVANGYCLNYVRKRLKHKDRAGWYLQQFLKLDFGVYLEQVSGNSELYLIWDADTVPLTKIHIPESPTKLLHNLGRNKRHKHYNITYRKIFGIGFSEANSAISQYMWCNRNLIERFKEEVQARTQSSFWIDGILTSLDGLDQSEFSEYEFLVNYCNQKYPGTYENVRNKWFLHGADIVREVDDIEYADLQKVFTGYQYVAFERHKKHFSTIKNVIRRLYALVALRLRFMP